MDANDHASANTTLAARVIEQRRLPIATVSVVVITTIVTSLQFVYPQVLHALDRNPEALAAGQWWRLVTPRFVQPEIWPQFVLLGIIAVVGPAVEQCFGSRRWLVLYFVPGLIGEVISLAWQPSGAGASVALCGLIGAWSVLLLRRNGHGRTTASFVALCFVAGLTGAVIGGLGVAVVLSGLVGGLLVWLLRRNTAERTIARFVGIAGLLGAVALTVFRDQHGPPLIVGACLAAAMLWRDESSAAYHK